MIDYDQLKKELVNGLNSELASPKNPNKEANDVLVTKGYISAVNNVASALKESDDPVLRELGFKLFDFGTTYRRQMSSQKNK